MYSLSQPSGLSLGGGGRLSTSPQRSPVISPRGDDLQQRGFVAVYVLDRPFERESQARFGIDDNEGPVLKIAGPLKPRGSRVYVLYSRLPSDQLREYAINEGQVFETIGAMKQFVGAGNIDSQLIVPVAETHTNEHNPGQDVWSYVEQVNQHYRVNNSLPASFREYAADKLEKSGRLGLNDEHSLFLTTAILP